MHRLSAPPGLNWIRAGSGQLKYRAIAAGLGSAMLAATLAVGPPASAATGAGPAGWASLATLPLPRALSRLTGGHSATSGKPAGSKYAAANLEGVSALSASDAWAVGWEQPASPKTCTTCTLIEHWNGKSWQRVTSPNPTGTRDAGLYAVKAISATDVWAVGFYYCPQGSGGACTDRTLTEHWNGKSWKIVPSPNPTSSASAPVNQLEGVTAVSATNVWAVGSHDSKPEASGPDDMAGLVEHWNGKSWKIVTSPNAGSQVELRGVAAVSATDIWAVGDDTANGGSGGTIVEQWNGHNWKAAPSPSPDPSYSNLQAVAAVSTKDVWAVGNDLTKNGMAPLVEHWNGKEWQQLKCVIPESQDSVVTLAGVDALSADNVWAVGTYGNADYTLVEHWNGKSWAKVASPNSPVASYGPACRSGQDRLAGQAAS